MNTKDAIRYTLIELMEENNVSGSELAAYVGVSKQSVSAWRNGKSCIDVENIPAICEYFGISIGELFGKAKKKSQPDLSSDERELLRLYRAMSPEYKSMMMKNAVAYAEMTSKSERCDCGDVERIGAVR